MKKLFLLSSVAVMLCLGFILACSKQSSDKQVEVQNLKIGNKISFSSSAGRFAPGEIGDLPGGGGPCNCNGHGGSGGGTLQWTLATCRTNCTKGIGFRCGRQGILQCVDGTIVVCIWGANCPAQRGAIPERDMEADYEFYDNGTMKLTFKKAIPDEEKNSSTGDVFEVESTDHASFNTSVIINGISYTGFNILQGNYQINYTDGQFGSVVVAVQFTE